MTANHVDAETTPESVPQPPRFLRRHWGKLIVLTVIGGPLLFLTLWTATSLLYKYSEGDRTGYMQKLSLKGWICKTWEGELAMSNVPGQMPEKFYFTVRSDSLAEAMRRFDGKRVVLSYAQHVKVPTSCLGDTEYWVTAIRAAE